MEYVSRSPGPSFSNRKIRCISRAYVIVNLISLGYGLLIGQKKTFVDVILRSDKIQLSIICGILLKK